MSASADIHDGSGSFMRALRIQSLHITHQDSDLNTDHIHLPDCVGWERKTKKSSISEDTIKNKKINIQSIDCQKKIKYNAFKLKCFGLTPLRALYNFWNRIEMSEKR